MNNEPIPLDRGAKVLNQAQIILRPLVAWLLRSGVGYTAFAAAAKLVFLEQAQEELRRSRQKETDSNLSMLSGLHRKNVRDLRQDIDSLGTKAGALGKPSLASQVLTRWLHQLEQPELIDGAQGKQSHQKEACIYSRRLKVHGNEPSFETLSKQVSRDVHPRTVLNELSRLGLVSVDFEGSESTEIASLHKLAFTPSTDHDELLELLSGAVSDHLWSGVNNITTDTPKRLEQSVFADGLTQESIQELSDFSNNLWSGIFHQIVSKSTQLGKQDQGKNGNMRMRLGMYFFNGAEKKSKTKKKQT